MNERIRDFNDKWTCRVFAVALGIAVALSALIVPCWWSVVVYHHPACSLIAPADFIALYAGAHLMVTNSAGLYDIAQQLAVQIPIDPSSQTISTPYYYPPFFGLVLAPLGWLSFSQAFVMMSALNLALLGWSIKLLANKFAFDGAQTKWFVLAAACNYGLHYTLVQGQTSIIALTLMILFIAHHNYYRAGVWAALLCFKPTLAIMPLMILLVRKNWTALAVASGVLATLGATSLFAVSPAGIEGYIRITLRLLSDPEFLQLMHERMHNLRAIAYYYFDGGLRDYLWWASTLAIFSIDRHSELARQRDQ
jgi:hypothetical protein